MSAKDVAGRLAMEAERVAAHLLPGGKREGSEWVCGSVQGEAGQSCKVCVSGDKAGVWADFASGQSGDLLDLWAAVRGMDLGEALGQARMFLGMARPDFSGHQPKRYERPAKPQARRPREGSPVMGYLTGERRLSDDAVAAYKLAEDGSWMVFPYLRPSGDLIFWKKISIDRDLQTGKKRVLASAGAEPILFGWQAIAPTAREVVITEGELDAVSLWQYGWPALSVPTGASAHAWIESEFEHLERFDVIHLAFDMDASGRKGVAEVAERLGRHRCRIVELPHEDANACLMAGVEDLEIETAIRAAATLDPSELKPAGSFVEQVLHEFFPTTDEERGHPLPWGRLRDRLVLRAGDVTIWAGPGGHGKSQAVGQVALNLMARGVRCCVASLEMHPRRWLRRQCIQVAGFSDLSEGYIRAIHEWWVDRLWVFDVVGNAKVEHLLEVFAYARARYGISLFVIDNLTKLGMDEEDRNAQHKLIDTLTDFAKEHNVHVLLVAHTRKGIDESAPPRSKADVRGAAALTDIADNVVLQWRNKPKEDALQIAQSTGDEPDAKWSQAPDALLLVAKNRYGEWEGQARLWFDRGSYRFLDRADQEIKPLVEYTVRADVGEGA